MKICRISSLFLLFLSAASPISRRPFSRTVYDQRQTCSRRAIEPIAGARRCRHGSEQYDGLPLAACRQERTRSRQSAGINVGCGHSGFDFGRSETDIQLKLSAVVSRVVVSAALGGALSPEIGSSVSLVSSREIEDRGAQNALEVIRGIPGIEVNQTGRRGAVTGVFIRGG